MQGDCPKPLDDEQEGHLCHPTPLCPKQPQHSFPHFWEMGQSGGKSSGLRKFSAQDDETVLARAWSQPKRGALQVPV